MMSKTGSIFLAVMIFFLSCFIVFAFLLASPSQNSSLYLIGFVVALGLGVGTYFLSTLIATSTRAREEVIAKAILEPVLPAGETLQGFVQGFTDSGAAGIPFFALFGLLGYLIDTIIIAPHRIGYYVGLTQQYLALVQVKGNKPTGVRQVLRRGEVKKLEYETRAFHEPNLILEFTADRMELRMQGSAMINRAKELDKVWRGNA